jgi:hypothetical protein
MERGAILLDVAGEGHYDFRNHFVGITELLFSRTKPFDYRDTTMPIPFAVGLVQILLSLIGTVGALIKKQYNIILYVFLSTLCLFLITPLSRPIWEFLPGMIYFQFPWRFLGPLAVFLVPVISNSTEFITASDSNPSTLRYSILKVSIVILIVVSAFPALYPIPWKSGFGKITRKSIIDAELEGRWRGTTSTNDFVPSTVDMVPTPSKSLIESYSNPPIDRVNRFTIPEGTTVTVLGDQPNHYEIKTQNSFILRLMLFHFPGWRAYINGIEQPIEIAHPEGFITLNIPPGNHQVLLLFKDTISRSIGWFLTITGVLVGTGVLLNFDTPKSTFSSKKACSSDSRNYDPSITPILIICLILIVVNQLILKPGQVMYYFSDETTALPAERKLYVEFGQQIALIGYDISRTVKNAGQKLEIQLYWQATQPITQTFQSFVHIMDTNGQILTQSDHLNPGGYPTNLWATNRYIRDKHILEIPRHTTPGTYPINVGIYSLKTNSRLDIVDSESGEKIDYLRLNDIVEIRR